MTLGERVPDAVAISAPVFDAGGRVVAALTIGGIASRYERERLVADASAVMRVAATISAELGQRNDAARIEAREEIAIEGSPRREALEQACTAAWEHRGP